MYIGFDQPKTLGKDEQGASAALPIFVQMMSEALADQPATPFRVPPGVRLVRVDAETGLLPGSDTKSVILEAFLPGTEPSTSSPPQGATASIAQEVYLGQTEGSGRVGQGPATPQGLPQTTGQNLQPQVAVPSSTPPPAALPRVSAPQGAPNTGGLY